MKNNALAVTEGEKSIKIEVKLCKFFLIIF